MGELLIPNDSDNPRSNNFNAVRLAAALVVVWSHSFALSLGSEKTEPISRLTNGHYNSGNIAVLVFFVISGFLICESYQKTNNTLEFLNKRIRRIYPGYMVATSIAAFVIVPLFSSRSPATISFHEISKTLLMNLTLRNYAPHSDVFSENPSSTLNGSLWSIPFEFWCYLGIALLGLTRLLWYRGVSAVIIVTTMAVRVWLDATGRKPGLGVIGEIIGWPYLWFSIIPCFMLGVVAYLYRDKIPRDSRLLAAFLSLFLLGCYAPVAEPNQKIIADAFFPLAMSYAVFCFAFSKRIKFHNAAAFGDFSYGTYLYAYPIQQMMLAYFGRQLWFPAFVACSVVLSLTAGIISWHLVERWFSSGKSRPVKLPLGVAIKS